MSESSSIDSYTNLDTNNSQSSNINGDCSIYIDIDNSHIKMSEPYTCTPAKSCAPIIVNPFTPRKCHSTSCHSLSSSSTNSSSRSPSPLLTVRRELFNKKYERRKENLSRFMILTFLIICAFGCNIYMLVFHLDDVSHDNLNPATPGINQSDPYLLSKRILMENETDMVPFDPIKKQILERDVPELLYHLESLSNDDSNTIEISNVIQPRTKTDTNSSPVITLVTQGSVSKFSRLLAILQRWDGPISCAMYITTQEELYTWHNLVQNQMNNTSFQNHVSMHLLFELPPTSTSPSFSETSTSPLLFYPINMLRNLALQNARKEVDYVFLNDIDLIPPTQSHTSISSILKEQELQVKTFWVLPAFERFADEKNKVEVNDVSLIPPDKSSLLDAIKQEDIAPFHTYQPTQHGHTNYRKWYQTDTIYDIEYGYKFEPYAIVRTQELHEFFPLFRGFGRNKSSFFLEAKLRGFQFKVLPNHFVVHMNHGFEDHRNPHIDGNSDKVYPKFQIHLEEKYGVSLSSSSETELMKTSFQFRDTDFETTKFPCHYLMNRAKEFEIIPNYDSVQHINSLVRTLPTTPKSRFDVTIASMMHISPSMFILLEKMATKWSGQISVAVFIPTNDENKLSEAKAELDKFQLKNEKILQNRVFFHLVIDLVENRGKDVNVFPRNLLRNVAMDNAHTDYVFILDMDLAPSHKAHAYLKKHLHKLEGQTQKNALVVPAFEKSRIHGKEYKGIVKTKSELMQMMKDVPKSYNIFLNSSKVQAHNATNYEKWYKADDGEMYEVSHTRDYEPYVVVRKDSNLPPFWEHFTGFGRNKLEWIEELFLSGYKFMVASDCFVVHKNHKKYGLRRVRPFIVDEYALRFQAYISKAYDQKTRELKVISKWANQTYEKWHEKVRDEEKIGHVTWENMVKMSEKRDNELEICINKVNRIAK